jgi:hypothetical protein
MHSRAAILLDQRRIFFMPLPITVITPALELLSDKIDILPASGGAVEDLNALMKMS